MLRSVENVGSTIFLKTLNRNDVEKIIMTLIKNNNHLNKVFMMIINMMKRMTKKIKIWN